MKFVEIAKIVEARLKKRAEGAESALSSKAVKIGDEVIVRVLDKAVVAASSAMDRFAEHIVEAVSSTVDDVSGKKDEKK